MIDHQSPSLTISTSSKSLTYIEQKHVFVLSLIFTFRLLGLFMILPVFSVYAADLKGATPFLTGVALGIYGLTQASFQIPFGMLSDHIGRKPVIYMGLILFMLGSVVAALSHTITGVIVGRALQGSGAIGSTLMALTADLTEPSRRTRAMAMIGLSIGLAFMLSMFLGPFLANWHGLSGIFWVSACFPLLGMLLLYVAIPNPDSVQFAPHLKKGIERAQFWSLLTSSSLLSLDFGIFVSHLILTASFFVLPILLQDLHVFSLHTQWHFYLPLLIVSFLAILPFIFFVERKKQMKKVFLAAVFLIIVTQGILSVGYHHIVILGGGLFFYFMAFHFLEASLPATVSKIAPSANKGSAMGIYSSAQFLGIFVGGVLGGLVYHSAGATGVFAMCALFAMIWFVWAVLNSFIFENP
jgi:MFS family permease